jgi:hypothetical protein
MQKSRHEESSIAQRAARPSWVTRSGRRAPEVPFRAVLRRRAEGGVHSQSAHASCRRGIAPSARCRTSELAGNQRLSAKFNHRAADHAIPKNRQSQIEDFSPVPTIHAANFLVRVLRHFMEDGLMKRVVWMTCVGLTLASFSGCHLCKKKHLRQASVIDGGSCECGPAIPSSYEGIPTAEPGVMVAPAPIPYSGPLPAPQKKP